MNPGAWGLIISGVVAFGSVIGVILSRIGKKGDQEQQLVKDQFDRMLSENAYITGQLTAARADVLTVRSEWEKRWDRQMIRCRAITDEAALTIARLMALVSPEEKAKATTMIRNIADHLNEDHS